MLPPKLHMKKRLKLIQNSTQFLNKKSQFNAKEMLRIQQQTIHPKTQMVSCIWNGDFLWHTPDLPSGKIIFFCPEVTILS
jgi:hypothetical protein